MSDRIECPDLKAFIEAVARAGARAVSLRTVCEVRPKVRADHCVEVGPQKWVELSGYSKGVLYVARLEGAEGEPIRRELEARGLRVKSSSDNVT